MKNIKNLIVLLVCVTAVLAAKTDNVPNNYPPQFTARFNETDLNNPNYMFAGMKTLYWDSLNYRARQTYDNGPRNQPSDQYLVNNAPQAPPSTDGFTYLYNNPIYPNNAPNNCYYRTQPFKNLTVDPSNAPFEDLWNNVYSNDSVHEFLFEYPEMTYAGVEYIYELGVYADRWDSVRRCNLQQSKFGEMPCTSVFQSLDGNGYTLKEINVNAVNPFSYYRDTYLVRVYHSFKPSVSDADFKLPTNWPMNCGYADSGFRFNRIITAYSDQQTALLAVSLSTAPIGQNAQVKVSFMTNPQSYAQCTDCIQLATPSLIFDSTNWNVPQAIFVNYANSGCTLLSIVASGGGYDWQYPNPADNFVVVRTCDYNPINYSHDYCLQTLPCLG